MKFVLLVADRTERGSAVALLKRRPDLQTDCRNDAPKEVGP
jgi:hypothetical protein